MSRLSPSSRSRLRRLIVVVLTGLSPMVVPAGVTPAGADQLPAVLLTPARRHGRDAARDDPRPRPPRTGRCATSRPAPSSGPPTPRKSAPWRSTGTVCSSAVSSAGSSTGRASGSSPPRSFLAELDAVDGQARLQPDLRPQRRPRRHGRGDGRRRRQPALRRRPVQSHRRRVRPADRRPRPADRPARHHVRPAGARRGRALPGDLRRPPLHRRRVPGGRRYEARRRGRARRRQWQPRPRLEPAAELRRQRLRKSATKRPRAPGRRLRHRRDRRRQDPYGRRHLHAPRPHRLRKTRRATASAD